MRPKSSLASTFFLAFGLSFRYSPNLLSLILTVCVSPQHCFSQSVEFSATCIPPFGIGRLLLPLRWLILSHGL